MSIPNYLLAFNPGQKLILGSGNMTLYPHSIEAIWYLCKSED